MEENNDSKPSINRSSKQGKRFKKLYWIIPLVILLAFIIFIIISILLDIYSVPLKRMSYENKCHKQPIVGVTTGGGFGFGKIPDKTYYKPSDKVLYNKYSNFVSGEILDISPDIKIEFFCNEQQAIDASYINSNYASYETMRPRCKGCKAALEKLPYTPYVVDYNVGRNITGTFNYTVINDSSSSKQAVISTFFTNKDKSHLYLEEIDVESRDICTFMTGVITIVGDKGCSHYASDKEGREILTVYNKQTKRNYFGTRIGEVLIKINIPDSYTTEEIVNIFNSLRPATKEELNRLSPEELV